MKKWTRDRIIQALRDWHQLYGAAPDTLDWSASVKYGRDPQRYKAGAWPSSDTVQKEFGRWSTALDAAGIPPRPRDDPRHWSDDAVLEAIRVWAARYGQPPTVSDWDPSLAQKLGRVDQVERFRAGRWPGCSTVQRRFGTWNSAITAAGFDPVAIGGSAGRLLEGVALERTESQLRTFLRRRKEFPSRQTFLASGESNLYNRLCSNGGIDYWIEKSGLARAADTRSWETVPDRKAVRRTRELGSWLAGLLDGEGSVMLLQRSAGSFRPVVSISNTDERLMAALVDRTGAGRIYVHRRKAGSNKKVAYTWRLSNSQMRHWLPCMKPWLVIKAKHVDLLQEALDIKGRLLRLKREDKERAIHRLAEIAAEIKALNRRGVEATVNPEG